jgi:hypothetical protein
VTFALYLLEERDCHSCTPENKIQWGCTTDALWPVTIDDEMQIRCPRRPFLDDPGWFNAVFQSSRFQEKNMLTEPGTWLDQPAKLTAAIHVVEAAAEESRDYKKTADERRRANKAKAARPTGGRK